jgi:hypothetical protein
MRNSTLFEVRDFTKDDPLELSNLDAEVINETTLDHTCFTPGNPYSLHCFPAHKTNLTKEHNWHLDKIAQKIEASFHGSHPITKVEIIGHSATWWGISKDEYARRALTRAKNVQAHLRGRLVNAGLGSKITLQVDQRANNEPLVDNMLHSSSKEARHNRAINRRVTIYLISSARVIPIVDPILTNISRVWIFATANQLMSNTREGKVWRKLVVDHGFTDVAIFINGQPKNYLKGKQETENYTYKLHFRDDKKIGEVRDFFKNAGIDIHLVTWIKPTKRYIESCARVTLPLCEKIGARSLLFDAEEPWYGKLPRLQLTQERSQEIIDKYFCHSFSDNPCCLGVTHIIGDPHTDRIKRTVGPLIEACDYSLPQAYTNTDKKDKCVRTPGCLQKRAARKWSSVDRTIVMGLWALSSGRTADWAKDISVTDRIKIMSSSQFTAPNIQEVAYWSLRALKSPRKSKFFNALNLSASAVRTKMSESDKLNSKLFFCPPLLRCRR